MICRVCKESISFVRGQYPGRKRKATQAVHDFELEEILQQTKGQIVHPPSGAQRTLRIKLEANHPPISNPAQTSELSNPTTEEQDVEIKRTDLTIEEGEKETEGPRSDAEVSNQGTEENNLHRTALERI